MNTMLYPDKHLPLPQPPAEAPEGGEDEQALHERAVGAEGRTWSQAVTRTGLILNTKVQGVFGIRRLG
jgi:hypothetical protein